MISIFRNWKLPITIEGLEIDTTISENHEYSNDVSDYPVEQGANITDHIKNKPEILRIEGITSNTPIRFITENFSAFLRDDGSNRMQLAYNTLLSYAGYTPSKQPNVEPIKTIDPSILTIVTGLKVYTNMVITSLTFPRTITTGESISYNIEFKKIHFVEAEFTKVNKSSNLKGKAPNTTNQAAKTADTGKTASKEVESESLLYQGLKGIKGFFN